MSDPLRIDRQSQPREFTASLCLIALVVACYWRVYQFEFLNFDDDHYVLVNRAVHEGLTGENLVWAFTTRYFANWHPLTWLSYMLDYEIYGLNASGYHVTNLLFHAINSVLVFVVFSRLTGARWQSAAVAALFAVHPLHVESVAWVSERKDVLSTTFGLLAIAAYVRYTRVPSFLSYCGVAILMSLSLMAKSMLVTLPCVLLLLDYWPLRRLSWRACLEKIPLIPIVMVVCVLAFVAQREAHTLSVLGSLPIQFRASNAAVSYLAYLVKLAWPQHLAMLYPLSKEAVPLWRVVSAFAMLATITAGVLWTARSRPYLIVGWLWFLGTLVPVIGVIQVGVQAMADRYVYVPAIGIYLAVVWAVSDMTAGWRYRAASLAMPAAGVLLALMLRTNSQVCTWRNSKTVYEHALRITSNNYTVHFHLGLALFDEGKYDEAIAQGQKALAIAPNCSGAHRLVGDALARQGKLAEAAFHYAHGLGVQDLAADALREKGDREAEQGRLIEAMRYYREALDIRPDFAEAHKSLADVLLQLDRLDDAIEHYSEAIRLNPNWTEAQRNLSEARIKIQKK